MQRYYDQLRDSFGNYAPGVLVYVRDADTGSMVTLYDPTEDLETPITAISNPLVTDANGSYSFAAPNGHYTLEYTGSNVPNTERVYVAISDTVSAANVAGADTQVQFNDGGSALGASADLTFDKTTGDLTVGGIASAASLNATGLSGITKATAGTLGNATAGVDYLEPSGSGSGLSGVVYSVNAASGTVTQDQVTGLASTGIVKRTGANTLEIATAGTDYVAGSVGSNTQVAYFSNTGVLTGDAKFTYTSGTNVDINETTASTTPTTGALTVGGGLGVAGAFYAAGLINSTATGDNTFGSDAGSGTLNIILNGAAANAKCIRFRSGGTQRWNIQSNATSETGSDAGSNLSITAYTDAGAVIDNPILINRVAGGTMTLTRPINITNTTASTTPTTGALTVAGGAGINGALFVGTSIQSNSGSITSNNSAGNAYFIATAPAGNFRGFQLQTSGSNRWLIYANSTAEAGANAGSDFQILARTDTGTGIDTPFQIARVGGGLITMARPTSITDTTASTTTTTGALKVAGGLGVVGNVCMGGVAVSFAASGVTGGFYFNGASTSRWGFLKNNTAESGGNAGSNFDLEAYTDAGALIDRPIQITRVSAGGITLGGTSARLVTMTGSLTVTNTGSFQGGINSSSVGTGTVIITGSGGLGVGGAAYIGGVTNVTNTTDSTSLTTGAIVTAGGAAVAKSLSVGNHLVLPKTTNYGIKVDTTTPTFPFHDIIGKIQPKATGAGSPVRTTYQGNIADYAFVANDLVDLTFHIPHDYVPGTDIYLHVHWSHNGTAITGNVVFTHYSTYAKGHNQANFPAEVTNTITYNTTNIATTPQYRHRIDEIALSTAGGSAALLNTTNLEVDGLILITLKVTTLPTITAGSLFIHTVDLHYQSTNVGTKAKAPNFYT
jgi:hypothetical protein